MNHSGFQSSLALELWENQLTLLWLIFLIRKMGVIIIHASVGCPSPFFQLKFVGHLLCAWQCSRCQGYSREQNTRHSCCPLKAYILE